MKIIYSSGIKFLDEIKLLKDLSKLFPDNTGFVNKCEDTIRIIEDIEKRMNDTKKKYQILYQILHQILHQIQKLLFMRKIFFILL